MDEYHKIVTVWERDEATKFKTLIEGRWATPELAYLHDCLWTWTEKVDGTNVRVMWDGERVTFGGKTESAQMPTFLLSRLQEAFPVEHLAATFDGPACLYGEGYGAKIQKGGGNYKPDGVDFVLFDVHCGGLWLTRESVTDIADKLKIAAVPVVGIGSLDGAIEYVRKGFQSKWGPFAAEGLVMRPPVELADRRGHRIIAKVKTKDFQ